MKFDRYKELVEKFYQNDCRELNFQNRILIPFLEQLIPTKYDVVDSSTLYKNWNSINRDIFAGQYTPDILVIENWKLFKKKQKPLMIIEVKSPISNDRKHAENEVKEYLSKSNHVILTDCITWEIYDKEKPKPSCFHLDNGSNDIKVCERCVPQISEKRKVAWKDDIQDNGWIELQKAIKEIIGN